MIIKTCVEDPRAHEWKWPLSESPPYAFATILIGYVMLIRFGPQVMKNRKPYNLQKVMIFYNAFQVFVNALASTAVSSKILNI